MVVKNHHKIGDLKERVYSLMVLEVRICNQSVGMLGLETLGR
jgi:hypothetical protein